MMPNRVLPVLPVLRALAAAAWCAGAAVWATEPGRAPESSGVNSQMGQQLAATCANCHGTDGRTQGAAFIALAGMPAAQLTEILALYKNGGRTGTVMHQIAKGYTDEQIRAIAAFFAAQKKTP